MGFFTSHINSYDTNGRGQPDARAQEECKQKCLRYTKCLGYGWIPSHVSGIVCYLSLKRPRIRQRSGATFYSLANSTRSCSSEIVNC